MKRLAIFFAGVVLLTFAGCGGGSGSETASSDAETTQAALPDGLFLAEAPADPMSIAELKAAEHAGEEVLITGRIGGRVAPFVEARAMFNMTDLGLPVCEVEEGDHCDTPWDSCCETPESIKANMITVQIVDGQGDVVKRAVKGEKGLVPMARLTIRGTVSQQDGDVVILDAREIFVHTDPSERNTS